MQKVTPLGQEAISIDYKNAQWSPSSDVITTENMVGDASQHILLDVRVQLCMRSARLVTGGNYSRHY